MSRALVSYTLWGDFWVTFWAWLGNIHLPIWIKGVFKIAHKILFQTNMFNLLKLVLYKYSIQWQHLTLSLCETAFTRIPTRSELQLSHYGKCSKISNTSCLPKRPRQTVQTQIRLLLKKQSDQGLPHLLFWHFVNARPDYPLFLWEQKMKSVLNFRTFTLWQILFETNLRNHKNPRIWRAIGKIVSSCS